MAAGVSVARSHTVAVGIEDAFARTIAVDLTRLFSHWFGPLPPIAEVHGQQGTWETPGQTRTIALKGGGTMREHLQRVDAPSSFAYEITGITGPLAPLVRSVDGAWEFAPDGAGTRVTWRWTLHPTSALTRPLVAVLGLLWTGYARVSLAGLDGLIA